MRIVSLLPSATEMVCALGLEEQLVGVTHECDYPAFVRELPRVTRTLIPADATSAEIDQIVREQVQSKQALYALDVPALEALQPDLIVTQALCDVCAVAEEEVRAAACMLPGAPRVINLAPQTLADALDAVCQVAIGAGVPERGDHLVEALKQRVEAVAARGIGEQRQPRVALLEWLDPPFSSGHWNPELVRLAGGMELLGRQGSKSRSVRWEEVIAAQPDVVFIACCGFGVERTMEDAKLLSSVPGWSDLPAVQSGRVYVTDGSQYFNRPGPRLVDSLEILAHALDPERHPLAAGQPAPVRVPSFAQGVVCNAAV